MATVPYCGVSGKNGGWFPNAVVYGQPTGVGTNFPYGPMTLEDATSIYWRVKDWQAVFTAVVTGAAANTTTLTTILPRGYGYDPFLNLTVPNYVLTNPLYLVLPCEKNLLANWSGADTNPYEADRLAHGVYPKNPNTYTGANSSGVWGGGGGGFGGVGGAWTYGINGEDEMPAVVSGYLFNVDSSGQFWLNRSNALTDCCGEWFSVGVSDASGNTLYVGGNGIQFGSIPVFYANYTLTLSITLPSGAVLSGLPFYNTSIYSSPTPYAGVITFSLALQPNSYFS